MSVGGFMFAKVSITDVSSNYPTVDDWCVAVHLARCEAFLRATERENGHWTPIQTNLANETTQSVPYDNSNTVSIYLAQIAPSSSYPAYISYFKDTDSSAEYALVTGAGFTLYTSSTSMVRFNVSRVNKLCPQGNTYYYLSPSFMHAMAMNGFSDYDITSSTVEDLELPFTPQYGIKLFKQSSDNSGSNVYSCIYNYTGGGYSGKTLSFGFAVKGTTIESFYQFDNGMPFWSVIGTLFTSDCIGGNPYGIITTPCNASADGSTSLNGQYWMDTQQTMFATIDVSGKAYPNDSIKSVVGTSLYATLSPSYRAERANSTIPENLYYGALHCSFNTGYSTYNIAGLDADGNLQKGFVDTDIIRVIPKTLCRSAGSLFQNGNFIGMGGGADSSGSGNIGIILGWDPSNPSLLN